MISVVLLDGESSYGAGGVRVKVGFKNGSKYSLRHGVTMLFTVLRLAGNADLHFEAGSGRFRSVHCFFCCLRHSKVAEIQVLKLDTAGIIGDGKTEPVLSRIKSETERIFLPGFPTTHSSYLFLAQVRFFIHQVFCAGAQFKPVKILVNRNRLSGIEIGRRQAEKQERGEYI